MVLEQVLKEENSRIDRNANQEKEVVNYLINSINSNYQQIEKVFSFIVNKKIEKNLSSLVEEFEKKGGDIVRKEYFEIGIYVEFQKMIKKLSNDSGSIIGIDLYSDKTKTPDIKLGYTEYFENKGLNSFGKKLTKKGEVEINLYRKLKGHISISEQKEKGEKMLASFQNRFQNY